MKIAQRHGVPRLLAALLVLGLGGCLGSDLSGGLGSGLGGGRSLFSGLPPRPDPPPIPSRKPMPPAAVAGLAAPSPAVSAAVPAAAPPAVPVAAVSSASLDEPAASPQAVRRTVEPASPQIARQSLEPSAAPTAPSAPAPAAPPAPIAAAPAAPGVAYRVQHGDTVYAIARRFAVPPRAVIDGNDLAAPYELRVGQVLRVPKPRRHVVRPGDTLYGVADAYGVEASRLVRLNRIRPPFVIQPGQSLMLPPPSRAVAQAAPATTPASGLTKVAAAPGAGDAEPATPLERATAVLLKPPPRAGGRFLWPTRGRTIAGYGPKADGLHNDGINIAAPRGTPVFAAENGVVAYVGNELRGFGNLILIKHSGGWVTAYAHTDEALVRRGERVEAGQVIARVGSSGNVASPQLHFEIRRGTRSVDPTRLLGAQKLASGRNAGNG